MTNDKVNQVLSDVRARLISQGHVADRYPAQGLTPSRDAALRHCVWMCEQALAFEAERIEKKMRWLGFIQGVLWAHWNVTIEESKQANRSEDD